MHDAGTLLQRDVVPGDHAVADSLLCWEVVERPLVLEADEVLAPSHMLVLLLLAGHAPFAVAQSVLDIRPDRGGDVRGQRPRRRRPDNERLPLAPLEGEADEERRMVELLVFAGEELVLRDRGPAARAPGCRAVALVQPPPLVDGLQEPPDVLD